MDRMKRVGQVLYSTSSALVVREWKIKTGAEPSQMQRAHEAEINSISMACGSGRANTKLSVGYFLGQNACHTLVRSSAVGDDMTEGQIRRTRQRARMVT